MLSALHVLACYERISIDLDKVTFPTCSVICLRVVVKQIKKCMGSEIEKYYLDCFLDKKGHLWKVTVF